MPPFLYRCPNTGDNVQAWAADDPEDDDLTYVQVTLPCVRSGASGEPEDRQRSWALMTNRGAGFSAFTAPAEVIRSRRRFSAVLEAGDGGLFPEIGRWRAP